MGDHIHPPLEGMWATSIGSEIQILNPPLGVLYLGSTILMRNGMGNDGKLPKK